jgi:hypothetical protein
MKLSTRQIRHEHAGVREEKAMELVEPSASGE